MSKLHKFIKAHENMTRSEKEVCKCDMCKNLNTRTKKKVTLYEGK